MDNGFLFVVTPFMGVEEKVSGSIWTIVPIDLISFFSTPIKGVTTKRKPLSIREARAI
jgi:hypothetical protein